MQVYTDIQVIFDVICDDNELKKNKKWDQFDYSGVLYIINF